MTQAKRKKIILEELSKVPILEIACNKAGVSRMSVYRWQKSDLKFAKKLNEALHGGKELISDVAESQLIAAIKRGQISALIFWLKNHRDDYKARLEISGELRHIREEMTDEEFELFTETLKLAGYSAEDISSLYQKHDKS